MIDPLQINKNYKGRRGPVVLAILDGVGCRKSAEGNAVSNAVTYALDWLESNCPGTKLQAHGLAVGLPSDDDMGNSEVGHNAIGCGRVFAQGAKLVNLSIENGTLFNGAVWKKLAANTVTHSTSLHLIGLFSDGNVHSHINHLKALILQAKQEGVKKVFIHILLDGRDVGETSALEYINPFEEFLVSIKTDAFTAQIASGGGRQVITMDRYGANWDMVRKGWETHVLGLGRGFPSAREAVETLRKETAAIDQDLPPFVIVKEGKPIGAIQDNDSVIFFNFRGDRALEITSAFEDDNFTRFDRKRRPKVEYAGMMQYDGDMKVPKQFLVDPPAIDRTLGEYLTGSGIKQMAVSETQKYGHVTYFFNGNRTGKFSEELEDYIEITSDIIPFEQRPWMKAGEITDTVIDAIKSGKYGFIRLNFPNGDMVGHTGIYQAAVCAVEAVDISLGRIIKAVKEAGGVLITSADHGNSEEMFEQNKKTGEILIKENGEPQAKTSHTLNPVPCYIFDPEGKGEYKEELRTGLGISSLAATVLYFLGYIPPKDYDKAIVIDKGEDSIGR